MCGAGGTGSVGGSFFVSSAALTLYRCSVWHTKATNAAAIGGGIYVEEPTSPSAQANTVGTGLHTTASVTLNATLINGTRASEGGAVFAVNSVVVLSNSVLQHSTATEFGGCLFASSGSTVHSDASRLERCAATSGGAVFASGSVVSLNGTSVLYNAADQGAGVYVATFGAVALHQTTVGFCRAGSVGGGVYVQRLGVLTVRSSRITGEFRVCREVAHAQLAHPDDMMVAGNVAVSDGGGLFVTDSLAVTMVSSILDENRAEARGGGLLLQQRARVTLAEVVLAHNEARAGAALFIATDSELHCDECGVVGNTAASMGGAFAVDGVRTVVRTMASLTRSVVMANSAVVAAGAFTAASQAHRASGYPNCV